MPMIVVDPSFFGRAIDVLQRYDNVSFVYSWVRFFGDAEGCWPAWNAEFPLAAGA
jgi:glycogen(starch) synthase